MVIRSPSAAQPRIDPDFLPLQRLYHWEKTTPGRVWLTQPFNRGEVRQYTWQQTADEIRRMANFLQAQNWPAGSRIAVLGKNTAGWIMADLAIWMAGHVSVPLYPLQTAENIRQIATHSESVACFVGRLDDKSLLDGIPPGLPWLALPLAAPEVAARCQYAWDDVVANTAPINGSPLRRGDELATIVYTSGTTGMAKGVMHSFDTLAAGVMVIERHAAFTQDERVLSYLPLAHIMERVGIELGSLHVGCQVFFSESLATFTADLQRARPTFFVSVPRLWLKFQQGILARMPQQKLARMLRIPLLGYYVRRKILRSLGLDTVRIAVSGSAPLADDVLHWFDAIGLPIYEGYGMTELGNASHSSLIGGIRWGTVGCPGDGIEQRIDPESGEIQVKSPAATLGYYKAPELTAELFTADGWLRTGDKGTIDPDGKLRIVGRLKDNFKCSKGKYVAPGPIEHKLFHHPAIDSCLVVGSGLPQPIGLVVLNAATAERLPAARAALESELAAHLSEVNAGLDPHEQLDCIVVSTTPWTPDNGLLTPTLKVRRPQIEQRFGAHFERWASARAPVVWAE